MDSAKWLPEGEHGLAPYLIVRNAARAIEYYAQAFHAKEIGRSLGPDGRSIMHAHLRIGSSSIFLTDENLEWGARSPQALGGTPISLYLYVENADNTFQSAVSAGGKAKMEMQDSFWGDRWGMLEDPFGHVWQIATRQRNLSSEEIKKGMQESMAKMEKRASV